MSFSSGEPRIAEGHAASSAAFLADATNKVSGFEHDTGEYEWVVQSDFSVDTGIPTTGFGIVNEIGNDVISPWKIIGRTGNQIDAIVDDVFDGNRSALATIYTFDQKRDEWVVETCTATWRTENPHGNRYLDLIIEFMEANELA